MYIIGLHPRENVDAGAHVERVKAHARARARGVHGTDAGHAVFHRSYHHAMRGFSARLSPEIRDELAAHEDIKYIVPVGHVRPAELPLDLTTVFPSLVPWNASAVRPWHLDRLDQASNALDGRFEPGGLTGTGVDIYVLDTGVVDSHPELANRTIRFYDADSSNYGNTSAAWAADCDADLHGTAVASIAAGRTVGVAPNATVLAAKVFQRVSTTDPNSACKAVATDADVIGGVDAVLRRIQSRPGRPAVVLLGLASTKASDALSSAINAAYTEAFSSLRAAGAVVITAAGNDDADACRYPPGNSPNAINVGASDQDDFRTGFSNWGPCVSLLAPGQNMRVARQRRVLSACPAYFVTPVAEMNGVHTIDHGVAHGTSYSAAVVAGLAALYREAFPAASPSDVEAALVSGSPPLLDPAGLELNTPNRLASATQLGFPGMASQPGPAAYNYSALGAPMSVCSTVSGTTSVLWTGGHRNEANWPSTGVIDIPSPLSRRGGVFVTRLRVESDRAGFVPQVYRTEVSSIYHKFYIGNPLLPSHLPFTLPADGLLKPGTYYMLFQGRWVAPDDPNQIGRGTDGLFGISLYDRTCLDVSLPLSKTETCPYPAFDMLECGSVAVTSTVTNSINPLIPSTLHPDALLMTMVNFQPVHSTTRFMVARFRVPFGVSSGSFRITLRTNNLKAFAVFDRCPNLTSADASRRGRLIVSSISYFGGVSLNGFGGTMELLLPPELLAGQYYVLLAHQMYSCPSPCADAWRPADLSLLSYPNKVAYCTRGVVPEYRPFCPAAVPTLNAPFCGTTRSRLKDWPLASSIGFPNAGAAIRAIFQVSDIRRTTTSVYISVCSIDLDFVPTIYSYIGCPTSNSSRLVKSVTQGCEMTITEAFHTLQPQAPFYIVVEGVIAADSNRTGDFALVVSDADCNNTVGAGPWPRPPTSGSGGSSSGGTGAGGSTCPAYQPPTQYYDVQCPGGITLEKLEPLPSGSAASVCGARMPDLKQLLVNFGNWSGRVNVTQSPRADLTLLPAIAAPVSGAWSAAGLPSSSTGKYTATFAIDNQSGAGPRGSCTFTITVADIHGPFAGAVCPPRTRTMAVPSGQCTAPAPDLRDGLLFATPCLRHVAADASTVQSIPAGTQLVVGQSYAMRLYSSRFPAGSDCPVTVNVQRANPPAVRQLGPPQPAALAGAVGGRPALVPVKLPFAMSDECADHAAACRVVVRAAGDALLGAAGDALLGAAGDALLGAAGDALLGAAGDALLGAAGDALLGAAGDALLGAAGDALLGAAGDALLGAAGMQTLDGAPYAFWNQTCREDFSTVHLSPYVAPGSYTESGQVVRTYHVHIRCTYGGGQPPAASPSWAIPVLSP